MSIALIIPNSAGAQVLVYSTYVSPYLFQYSLPLGMAVNSAGESCLFGDTALVKLASDGSQIYSVILHADLERVAVAIDSQGNCYASSVGTISPTAGVFQSTPKASSSQYVVKIDGTGKTVYATYLGGSGSDTPTGMAVDSVGNVYLTGTTSSNDFPTLNAYQPHWPALPIPSSLF